MNAYVMAANTARTTPVARTSSPPLPPASEMATIPAIDTTSAAIDTPGTCSRMSSGASIAMKIGAA